MSGSTLTFLFDDDRVLLLRRSPTKQVFPGLLNGVGGRIEPTDPDVESSAIRELVEETGLTPGRMILRGCMVFWRRYTGTDAVARGVVYIYTCHGHTGRLCPQCDEGELLWYPVAVVPSLPVPPELPRYWPRLIERPPRPLHVFTEYLDDQSVRIDVTE